MEREAEEADRTQGEARTISGWNAGKGRLQKIVPIDLGSCRALARF